MLTFFEAFGGEINGPLAVPGAAAALAPNTAPAVANPDVFRKSSLVTLCAMFNEFRFRML
jgi:uncharacterized protein YfdQ (DUF2303 family)